MTNYNNSAVYTRKNKNKNNTEVRAAIYCRLSKDDDFSFWYKDGSL